MKRSLWCRLGLHMWGFIRNKWDGHRGYGLYQCRDCGKYSTRRIHL